MTKCNNHSLPKKKRKKKDKNNNTKNNISKTTTHKQTETTNETHTKQQQLLQKAKIHTKKHKILNLLRRVIKFTFIGYTCINIVFVSDIDSLTVSLTSVPGEWFHTQLIDRRIHIKYRWNCRLYGLTLHNKYFFSSIRPCVSCSYGSQPVSIVYRRPSVFKYVSLLQSSHFGTLNNLGKYIYYAFALRKQLTNDNWNIQPPTVHINLSFSFFLFYIYMCSILSYNMCLYCKMFVRWWTVMFKSQIKIIYLSIYLFISMGNWIIHQQLEAITTERWNSKIMAVKLAFVLFSVVASIRVELYQNVF